MALAGAGRLFAAASIAAAPVLGLACAAPATAAEPAVAAQPGAADALAHLRSGLEDMIAQGQLPNAQVAI
ncbi:MAG: hypothetical protein EOP02_22005, partial [Proteobacteria bacterium]